MRNPIKATVISTIILLLLVASFIVPMVWAISYYLQVQLLIVTSMFLLVATLSILIGIVHRCR